MSKKKRKKDSKGASASTESSDDAIKINKSTLWQVAAVAFGILFLISLATGGFGVGDATEPVREETTNNQPSADSGQDNSGNAEVSLEGARTKGNEDSDVVLTEFSSMTCPFCQRHNLQTAPQIEENYIDNDKIFYAYKHFARNEMDVTAANAAECAGEQGQFFEYKQKVFENQDQLNEESLRTWAEELGLNMDEWTTCFEEDRYREKVISDTEEARNLGISGTPGFVLNGEVISGAQPYQTFEQAIESELSS